VRHIDPTIVTMPSKPTPPSPDIPAWVAMLAVSGSGALILLGLLVPTIGAFMLFAGLAWLTYLLLSGMLQRLLR
jgi:cytochrome b561